MGLHWQKIKQVSQQIPKNQFGTGAGKGDAERPVNRAVFRQNMDKIKKGPLHGKPVATKAGKTTYKY
jgi:hypothetical protein